MAKQTVFPWLTIPGFAYKWLIDFVRARTGTDTHLLWIQKFTMFKLSIAYSSRVKRFAVNWR